MFAMMKRNLLLCVPLASLSLLTAQMPPSHQMPPSQMAPPMDFSNNQKIAIQNSILAKVNGTTISMMDVKKQMDLLFHHHYSHLSESSQARFQFYEASWRRVLMELIDNELILSDAADKEIKLSDGEVREEMETRFGPSVLSTLDKIGLTYEEAWKMVRNEMIVRRMSWWFIQSRAIQAVTPQEIRRAYHSYIDEHPPYQEISYRIVSIRSGDPEIQAAKIYQVLAESGETPDALAEKLREIEPSVQISSVFTASDREISEAHKTALSPLLAGTYSAPVLQKSRSDNQTVARIFYLIEKKDHPAPAFQDLSSSLREQLIQQAAVKESQTYVTKLRKHYGFDAAFLKDSFPDDLHPFSIQ